MKSFNALKKSVLLTEMDRVGLWHWRVGAQMQARIRRFSALIEEVLACDQEAAALGAYLVCLDGVSPGALSQIEKQCALPYSVTDDVVLEWEELAPPRTERRVLSGITASAWPTKTDSCDNATPSCMPATGLVQRLEAYLAGSLLYRSSQNRLLDLQEDAQAWWYQALPAPLFAHQCGLQVLSALPRSALARLHKKQAVVHHTPPGQEADQIDADLGFTPELVNATDTSTGEDKSVVVLKMGLDQLTFQDTEVDGLTKRRWAQSLVDLQARAQSTGPITSVLLAWCLHLCENGTAGQSNLARTTVQKYFRQAALPLFDALKLVGGAFGGILWTAVNLQALYLGLIEVQSAGSKKTMASALTSFHGFLVEWFDIDPLAMDLHGEVPVARVQAQVIWPHEADLVMNWLDLAEDVRIRMAATIMLRVAGECPVRTVELSKVRIANIRVGSDAQGPCIEIEIARRAEYGRLKTLAAQRRLIVRDMQTMDLILRWVGMRFDEGAPISAMLFGDPSDDGRIYRGATVVSLLNRMLKAATGEAAVRFHTLRHTAVGACLESALSSSAVMDPNRFAIAATHTGHASPVSTFQSYFHRYEWSLRSQLDAALQDLVQVSSAVAARHLKLKQATLRQHVHRSGMKQSEFIWWQIRQMRVAKPFEDAATPFDWRAPVMPVLPARDSQTLTVAVVLSLLEGLVQEDKEKVKEGKKGVGEKKKGKNTMSAHALALCFGVPIERMDRLIEEATTIGHQLSQFSWPGKFNVRAARPLTLYQAVCDAGLNLARAHQKKFQKLQDFLSQEQAFPLLQQASISWKNCRHRGVVALDQSGDVLGLYKLLHEAKVDPLDLKVCVRSFKQDTQPASDHDIDPTLKHRLVAQGARDDFCSVFGVFPREADPKFRTGEAPVYLHWDDPEHRMNSSEAGSSSDGLDAWMFAVSVFLKI